MTCRHTRLINTVRHIAIATVMAALVGTGVTASCAHAASGDPAWGALESSCDSARLSQSKAAGLSVVEVTAVWARYLPQRSGVVDTTYVNTLRTQINRCLSAGFRVVLSSGTQYPPAWVKALPGAQYKDQRGQSPATDAIDVVFSSSVRAAQADYLKRLVADLPSAKLDAIRIGTTDAGEIGYPGPDEAADGSIGSWWAFGAAPQQGTGLATGMSKSPLPGWVPGQKTWNGRSVTAADARTWFTWYERALVGSLKFQNDTLRGAGFANDVHLPTAGRGVLPQDYTAATTALLNGTADRDESLERGLYYVDQLPYAASSIGGRLVVDITGVDDGSTVTARALSPAQDKCTIDDAGNSVAASTPVETWPNMRFVRAQAARAGLAAIGENPGPPGPDTGGSGNLDSELEQVKRAPNYARSCGMATLLFAFEDDLFTGRSGISLNDYKAAIAAPPA